MPTKHRRTPEEKRILAAVAAMPYGNAIRLDGLKEAERTGRPLTMHDLADYLEDLQRILGPVQADERRYETIESRVRTVIEETKRLLKDLGV